MDKHPPETEPFTFMGHPVRYWMELQRKAELLDVKDLLEENAKLRGKVAFYEHHVGRMSQLMNQSKES